MKSSKFLRFSHAFGAFLATGLLLAGCASPARYIYDLTPVSSNVSWRNGQAMSRCSEAGLDVEAGFVREEGGTLRFALQVHNRSTDTIDLDPSKFRVVALLKDSLGRESRTDLFVYDRELIRPRIDEALVRADAEKNPYRYTGLDATADLVTGIVGIASAFSKKTPQQRQEEQRLNAEHESRRNAREQDEANWDAAHDRKMNELRRERDFWTNEAIARSTLAPGGSASGILMSALRHEAIANDVEVRTNGRECRITFRQISRKL